MNHNFYIVKVFHYIPPRTEVDNYLPEGALLADSGLTDGGAGDFIGDGEEFVF